ncbi:MAG: hypothetical protein R3B70_27800 [Polyangiaceae bacterium]
MEKTARAWCGRSAIGVVGAWGLAGAMALLSGCAQGDAESAQGEEGELGSAAAAVAPASGDDWTVVVTTAPGLPQDVWMTGHGSNEEGWSGGGSVCLGVLANDLGPTDPVPSFLPGEHATLLTDVVEAGVFGEDGTPVPPGDYVAPGLESDASPSRDFTLAPGEAFYVIFDGEVINSSQPPAFPFPVGSVLRFMFTMDYEGEGRQVVPTTLWVGIPDGGGGTFYVPFLNEGDLMLQAIRN